MKNVQICYQHTIVHVWTAQSNVFYSQVNTNYKLQTYYSVPDSIFFKTSFIYMYLTSFIYLTVFI